MMKFRKILSLLPLLWLITCCSKDLAKVSTIDQEDKTYYQKLFNSLPKPLALGDSNEETVIYKFYSPWCHSCMEELSQLQNIITKKDKTYKVYLFTIDESDTAKERFGFKVHYVEGLFDKTKYQQVPLTFIFKNKILSGKFASPMNYSKL